MSVTGNMSKPRLITSQTNYDIDTRDWENGGVGAENTYHTILAQHR